LNRDGIDLRMGCHDVLIGGSLSDSILNDSRPATWIRA